MKRRFLLLLLVFLCVGSFMVGCEKSTQIRAASFSEITSAGSKNFGVRVSYSEDKRLKGKGTDVQIKFNKLGTIKIGKEGQEKFDYEIEDYDEWYSLTHIFNQADKTTANGDKFEKFEDALSKTYLFNFDGQMNVTLRVVVGDIEDNSEGNGQILVASQPISKNFTLKIK